MLRPKRFYTATIRWSNLNLVMNQPRRILRRASSLHRVHSQCSDAHRASKPARRAYCKLMRQSVKPVDNPTRLSLSLPALRCISPRPVKRTSTERSDNKPPVHKGVLQNGRLAAAIGSDAKT